MREGALARLSAVGEPESKVSLPNVAMQDLTPKPCV